MMPSFMCCSECGRDDRNENIQIQPYQYDWSDDSTTVDLCYDCAVKLEFCVWCGTYYGGTEEWFRAKDKGMCTSCERLYDNDEYWDDDDAFDQGFYESGLGDIAFYEEPPYPEADE